MPTPENHKQRSLTPIENTLEPVTRSQIEASEDNFTDARLSIEIPFNRSELITFLFEQAPEKRSELLRNLLNIHPDLVVEALCELARSNNRDRNTWALTELSKLTKSVVYEPIAIEQALSGDTRGISQIAVQIIYDLKTEDTLVKKIDAKLKSDCTERKPAFISKIHGYQKFLSLFQDKNTQPRA
ncbi:MAG: hypothetical protein KDD56_10500, partial [Bdellovibrionales bacterium]|nr:hypothetical protein [Bdellovibrionales bacterium]